MTQQRDLEVLSSAGEIFSNTARAMRSLLSLHVVAVIAIFGIQLLYFRAIRQFVDLSGTRGSAAPLIAALVLHAAAMALLIGLLALAVLRFELLQERPGRDAFPGPSSRTGRFLLPALVLAAVYTLPALATTLGFGALVGRFSFFAGLALPITVFGYAASVLLMVVFLPLFAATAVDSPGASLANAIDDTRRQAWRIFLVWLLVSTPIWGLGVVSGSALTLGLDGAPQYTLALINALLIVLWGIAMACTSALVYRSIGSKLADSPVPPPSKPL